MRVFALPGPLYQVAGFPPGHLKDKAKEHWRCVSCWQTLRRQGLWASEASQTVGVSRATMYRWMSQLKAHGPSGLEYKSRRPKCRRLPAWSAELAQATLELRERHPRWGKEELRVLLARDGRQTSASMVGRIVSSLKKRGVLREPPRTGVSARKRVRPHPVGARKPKDYQAKEPGDIVQVDTSDVRPLPGVVPKHLTTRDVVSRWDVVEVHTRATSALAAQFLDSFQRRLPFPLRAVQVDGGSEFQAHFEALCQERGVRLFVLPPSPLPKLNGHVERAQRTHTEEFYELYDGDLDTAPLNRALIQWEQVYNTVRPHQSLDWRTPKEYLEQCHPDLVPPRLCHMY